MSLPQVIDLVSKIGIGGFLIAVLYGSYKRIWVWGSELKKVENERDEWKELALSGTRVADALSDFAIRQRLSQEAAQSKSDRRERLAELATTPGARRAKRRTE